MIVLTIAGAVAYFLSGAPTQDVPSGLSTIPKEAVKEKPSKSAQSALTYHADGTITLDVRKARLELDARLIEHIPKSQIIAEVERLKAKYKGVERSKQLYVYFKKIIENEMPFDQLSEQVEYFASELGDNEWVNLTNHIAARFPGDFTKAELMFENRPFSSTYASILNAWLTGTASSYPGQSLKFIRSLPPDWQQSAQVSLVSSLASSGIEHALAAMDGMPPNETAETEAVRVALKPESADLLIDSLIADPRWKNKSESLKTALSEWAKLDPDEAAARAMKTAPGKAQVPLISGLINGWASNDPMAASDWLNKAGLEPEARDAGVMALVPKISHLNPKEALVWASSLTDGFLRELFMKSVYIPWEQKAPESAKAAMKELNIQVGAQNPEPAPSK